MLSDTFKVTRRRRCSGKVCMHSKSYLSVSSAIHTDLNDNDFTVFLVICDLNRNSFPSILFFPGPCCPLNLTVDQVTQAMTNVSWSHARGAHSFVTSLTSSHGQARCHTQDSHCLMGCITCGTNYTVTMEAYSHSGRMSNCTYQGFSSSE